MKKIILILLLILLVTPVHAKKFKVKNCDSSSMADINWAVDFIDNNIDEMLAEATFIPGKYKDKIKKKWPSTTLKCSKKKKCSGDTMGYHKKGSGNKFNLCWDQIRDFNQTRCELVGILMHEKAHAANVPIEKKHNDMNAYSYVSNVDLVYRFDDVVENVCTRKSDPNYVPTGATKTGGDIVESGRAGKLALDQLCSEHTQCASSKCGKGRCVCDDNNDCGSKSRCIKKIGKNYCVPTGGIIGDFCKKNSDCGIGKCEKKSCVCKKDTDCRTSFGSTNFRCAKPGLGFGKNFCQPTSVSNGGACAKNSDCNSGKCKKKKCVSK
ncbi:MAG: hypothetical protein NPIRA02_05780 [Nitrospirales bacterium]|nr:MAG: hypothetical protein NPIRA02_05780 [Nitrospirales bacterium]